MDGLFKTCVIVWLVAIMAGVFGTSILLMYIDRDIQEMKTQLRCIQLPACDTPATPVLPRTEREGK